jgi:probable F420-dependent oxidoreductase
MDAAEYHGPEPAEPATRVLAALRPPMLRLAAELADGAHPYFVPVEHTARAREILGAGALLAPEQSVLLETDADRARSIAREHTSFYLTAANYVENLRWLGWGEEDLVDGGSDALVDALVAWGDEEAIRTRVEAHLAAGANHVCIQPLAPRGQVDLDPLRALAPALLGL